MKTNTHRSSPTLAIGLLVGLFLALCPIQAEETVVWTGQWEAPALPTTAIPQWSYYRGAAIQQTEYLNIQSGLEATTAGYFIASNSGFWSPGPDGVTVDFALRVNAMEGENAGLLLASGFGPDKNQFHAVFFGPDWVKLDDGYKIPVEAGIFNQYRLTIKSGEATLYVNDASEPAFTSYSPGVDSKSLLSFGDLSSFGGGNIDWKYVKWSDVKAYQP